MSTDIKKLDTTLTKSNSISKRITDELTEIRKAVVDTNRLTLIKDSQPYQAKDSPYFPDRNFSNPLAVKGNSEETSWKEVKTFEETRPKWINEASSQEQKQTLVVLNHKKLNII